VTLLAASGASLVIGGLLALMTALALFVVATHRDSGHPLRVTSVRMPDAAEAASIESGQLCLVAPQVEGSAGLISKWSGTATPWRLLGDGRLVLATNAHVANGDHRGEVSVDVRLPSGRVKRVEAVAVAYEPDIDLALLVVDGTGLAPDVDFCCLDADRSTDWDALVPGTDVVAVGAPLGLPQTQTFGKVSACRQRMADGSPASRVVQFDATVMPGNSGGPLLRHTSSGWRWVGIVSAIGPRGIGMAIHASELERVRFRWVVGEAPSDPLFETRDTP
jgi:S1-C subfamily serine protease